MDTIVTKLFHCSQCFSHDIQWRAYISWDVMKQEMIIDEIDDTVEPEAYCHDCGEDVEVGYSIKSNRRFDNHGFYKTDKD